MLCQRVDTAERHRMGHEGERLDEAHCGLIATGQVDGDAVPVRHFGAVLSLPQWQAMADKLAAAGTKFVIEPYVRFKGEPGEQATMFFLDPSGNAIEFKGFGTLDNLFAK